MKRLVSSASFFLLPFFLISFSLAHAQIPTGVDGIEISLSPQNPNPGQDVTITVADYLQDITSANVSWVIDGKNTATGVGKTSVTVTAPPLGQTTEVELIASFEDGSSVEKSVAVKSGSVDLISESQGYAPPLYAGKQAFAYEDAVKIAAMPHLSDASGNPIDPATLVYNWKQDSNVLQSQSGYGKQSIEIAGSLIPRPTTITVDVSSRDGSETAEGSMTLTPGDPSIVFYRDDPLYGVLYNAALGAEASFSEQEMTLLAAPYSFTAPATGNGALQYSWTINGAAQPSLSANRSVTLRVEDTTADASYPVQLSLQNAQQILQGATQAITVLFKAEKNSNAPSL